MFRTLLLACLCLPSLALAQSPSQLPPPSASVAGSLISDDPTNAQGFGTAALVGGQINIEAVSGVVWGRGQTAAQQATNGTRLQAAFNYASAQQVTLVCPRALPVEYDAAAGLVVPVSSGGFRARLNKRCEFRQFHVNAPILTMGDPTGATPIADVDWEGGTLNYGVAQTGNTSAVCWLEGSLEFSHVKYLTVCGEYGGGTGGKGPLYPPWDAWDQGSRTANGFSYTNVYEKISVGGAQASLYRGNLNGTGNHKYDLYFHNGSDTASAGTLSDTGILFGGNGRSDDTCIRCNFEHFVSNTPIAFQTLKTMSMVGTHVEDVGTPYVLFDFTGAQVLMTGTDVLNFRGVTANAAQTTANNVQLFRAHYGAQVDLAGVTVQWDGTVAFASTGSSLFAGTPGLEGADALVGFHMSNFGLSDVAALTNSANMNLEPNIATPLSVLQRIPGSYTYDPVWPVTQGAVFTVPGGTFTLYGEHQGAHVVQSANLTSPSVVTLANTWKPSGIGSTRSAQIGAAAVYHRNGGTLANTSTVVNGAGTTLLTDAAASGGTASFATNVMTATAPTTGAFAVGEVVTAVGVAAGTTITSFGSGTGAAGTYNLSTTPGTIASETVSAASPLGLDTPFVTNGNNFAVAQ